MENIKIGLALGGGGALGIAHVGVLKALEENGIKPSVVVGTSIGALVGGVYATGMKIEKMEEESAKIKTLHLYDVNLNTSGFLSGRAAIKTLKKIMGKDYQIENLPTRFAAVAVDLKSAEELLLKNGSLINAIRASISVPGVFIPFKHDEKLLIDGGVLNNLPEDQVKNMGADVVLSVDLLHNYNPYSKPKTIFHSIMLGWVIMQNKLTQTKQNFSDFRINLDLNNFKQYIFNKNVAKQLIKIGYDETIKQMPEILKVIKNAENKQKKSLK